jgi:hypothetical protein
MRFFNLKKTNSLKLLLIHLERSSKILKRISSMKLRLAWEEAIAAVKADAELAKAEAKAEAEPLRAKMEAMLAEAKAEAKAEAEVEAAKSESKASLTTSSKRPSILNDFKGVFSILARDLFGNTGTDLEQYTAALQRPPLGVT